MKFSQNADSSQKQDINMAHKYIKVFSVSHIEINANWDYRDIFLTYHTGKIKSITTHSVGKAVDKQALETLLSGCKMEQL